MDVLKFGDIDDDELDTFFEDDCDNKLESREHELFSWHDGIYGCGTEERSDAEKDESLESWEESSKLDIESFNMGLLL